MHFAVRAGGSAPPSSRNASRCTSTATSTTASRSGTPRMPKSASRTTGPAPTISPPNRTRRVHGIDFDPATEIIVTPGGIKGALTLAFHAFVDPGDEAIIPVPNWPHYGDMIKLHGGVPRHVVSEDPLFGLTPTALRGA